MIWFGFDLDSSANVCEALVHTTEAISSLRMFIEQKTFSIVLNHHFKLAIDELHGDDNFRRSGVLDNVMK